MWQKMSVLESESAEDTGQSATSRQPLELGTGMPGGWDLLRLKAVRTESELQLGLRLKMAGRPRARTQGGFRGPQRLQGAVCSDPQDGWQAPQRPEVSVIMT